jgi:D-sedoheptulose 7-phosphate isomerase
VSGRNSWAQEIEAQLSDSAELIRETAAAAGLLASIAMDVADALASGHKVLLCGNGGSAADAQHVATELLARYKLERRAFPAVSLGTDVTFLTAMSNDVGFEEVFARQVHAFGRPGDLLWAFSTSGNSPNILMALRTARQRGLVTIGFTGAGGGKLKPLADHCLCVPSTDVPRIQEVHMASAHVICDLVERELAGEILQED